MPEVASAARVPGGAAMSPACPPGRMTSVVEIVAEAGLHGTVLPVMRSDVMVAVRRTDVPGSSGPAQVHLVGTAAGPLTGDRLVVRITVGDGARLVVRSAAATLALPARDAGRGLEGAALGAALGPAVVRYEVRVGAGAYLDLATEPLVVCRGADVVTETEIDVAAGGSAALVEHVVLGRHGEDGGRWRGRTVADVAGRPALRHTIGSDVLPGRTLVSRLVLGDAPLPESGPSDRPPGSAELGGPPPRAGDTVVLPLAHGGTLTTTLGPRR